MKTVQSQDGTTIAYDVSGDGPAVVLVSGASTDRASNQRYAAALADRFTVYNYDRRGRGDSGDTAPYAVEREIEDLNAVLGAAGGSAAVLGFSSGGALSINAAAAGSPITRLLLWEVPYSTAPDGPQRHKEYTTKLADLLAADRRGDAVEHFMNLVGLPAEMIAGMRGAPFWAGLEALAPTLAYDAAVFGDNTVPVDKLAGIAVPALVLDGGASPQFLRDASAAIADALPASTYRTLEGQDHNVAPEVITPVVVEFAAE